MSSWARKTKQTTTDPLDISARRGGLGGRRINGDHGGSASDSCGGESGRGRWENWGSLGFVLGVVGVLIRRGEAVDA